MKKTLGALLTTFVFSTLWTSMSYALPNDWKREWPKTDFTKTNIDLSEIQSGGPPKDGIPSIDKPEFISVDKAKLTATEPVIGLVINGDARAYPLQVLTWHEIVNDTVGGTPATITYCPLCNAAIVFDRRLADGTVVDFGTTGKLRKSDLVMYDRQSESWWQQFSGEAIVGSRQGENLKMISARLESFELFKKRFPNGKVLVPNNRFMRDYGRNPYVGYDSASVPFLYSGEMPEGISPMARVVVVGNEAWSLALLREKRTITAGDVVLKWSAGQTSALDSERIANGRDVGNVVVMKGGEEAVYHVTFAFVFHAFDPEGKMHIQ
ncbi:MAG: DUF3179 domain-containing protein [Rhodospirillales bacterium]|nr:DUF3179 domain-containing protein [Rhodospirillales bacterium]